MDSEITDLSNKITYYANSIKGYERMLPSIMGMDERTRIKHLSDLSRMSREMDEIISILVKKSIEERK